MEPVATKVYEATQDFTMAKYTPEGNPDGDVSYTAGTKYEMPAEVAALAPEGALKEVVSDIPPAEPVAPVEPVVPPEVPATTAPAAPVEPETVTQTAPAAPVGFVGGHTMADDEREGLPKH